MQMRSYIFRKLIYLVITLFAILTFNFFLFRIMPGDPARVLVPRGLTPSTEAWLMEKLFLDKPLWEQYLLYLKQVFTGDLGISTGVWKMQSIAPAIGEYVFNTMVLVGIGTVLALYFGILFGKYAAWRRGRPIDTIGMSFALVFYSMPTFLFALILLMVFAGTLQIFPVNGAYSADYETLGLVDKILDRGYHLVLPLLAFALEIMAEFAIIMRNSLTDVLTEDYITTARAKGLSDKSVLNDHAMRNATLPIVTVMAISIGWMLGGTIMVEMVFSYQGLGLLTWQAVVELDYCLLQAIFLLMAVAVLAANFIADILYFYLDPRVKI